MDNKIPPILHLVHYQKPIEGLDEFQSKSRLKRKKKNIKVRFIPLTSP
jgi:hypothetical protein